MRWNDTTARVATATVVVVFLAFFIAVACGVSRAGNQEIREHILYGGSNTDSTEQASPWIPVRGANRVVFRFWSAKAAFHLSTDADSAYSDSLTVFRIGWTDSITSTNPIAAGDSAIFTAAYVDTLVTLTAANAPTNRQLRGPGNGSGVLSQVGSTSVLSVGFGNTGTIQKQYMRVYVTPLRRNRATSWDDTTPRRVNGLKGFRGRAYVVFQDK